MRPKCFQAAAIICASAACIIFIVALASPSWLIGCIKYENIFSAMKNLPSISDKIKAGIDLSSAMLKDVNLCIHQGILDFTMEAGSFFHAQAQIPVSSLPIYQLFGAFGLIVAIGSLVTGAGLLVYAVSRNTEDYSAKSNASNFTRKAMIALVVAGVFGFGGMVIYSAGSAEAANDPVKFYVHFGQTGMGTELQKLGSKFVGELTPSGGRGKRDINLDGLNLNAEMKQYLRTMLDGLEPGYGYAFFLGWLAVVLVIVSVVLAALARKYLLDLPYNEASNVKL